MRLDHIIHRFFSALTSDVCVLALLLLPFHVGASAAFVATAAFIASNQRPLDSYILPGDYCEGETPVPIPNTEVKPLYADGTAFTVGE